MTSQSEAVAEEVEFERIRREHALLVESIEVAPTPFAVYDEQDRLIAWNKPYERVHGLAFRKLRSKAESRTLHYADLVRVIAEATMAPDKVDGYVRQRVRDQRNADGVGVDREYPDVGWYRVSKFKTRGGGIAGFAVDINEHKQREAELEQEVARRMALEEALRVQANTDSLTGVANRGAFLERGRIDFGRAKRFGGRLSVVMLDADHFKQVNDAHGHGVGDAVLVTVARALLESTRKDLDMVGRMGGEEFAIILAHAGMQEAATCAERVRGAISALEFAGVDGPFGISVSLGVADIRRDDDNFSVVLNRADQALYAAKDTGRNRMVLA